MTDIRVYKAHERPDVDVLVDGVWCEGELRMWSRTEDGWVAQVTWRRGPAQGNYISSFPADHVRLADG